MNVLTKELVLPANASGCFSPERRMANELICSKLADIIILFLQTD